jgi:hypothetical protein
MKQNPQFCLQSTYTYSDIPFITIVPKILKKNHTKPLIQTVCTVSLSSLAKSRWDLFESTPMLACSVFK